MPYYLSIGMSKAEFWEDDPYLAICYRDADTMQRRDKNEFIWLQGMYIYEAVASVMSAVFAKKGSKPQKYPEKPYRITPLTKEEEAAEREAERQKAIRSFNAWKAAWDRKNA